MPKYEIRDAAGKLVRHETTADAMVSPHMVTGETAHLVADKPAPKPAEPPAPAGRRK